MNLDTVRAHIDALDEQIIKLLNERLENVLEVARLKKEHQKELFAPARENRIMDRLAELNEGPLTQPQIMAIYREIISASIALQGGITIAYLGPEATNSHQAARNRFGDSATYMACDTFAEVVRAVESGTANYGLLPMENSREGSVTAVQDLLVDTELKIVAETVLKVDRHLLSNGRVEDVTKVHSHSQALAQCSAWLARHLPKAELHPETSTAAAVSHAKSEPGTAAIGSRMASETYGVPVLAECIQDQADNQTRFLVLSSQASNPSEQDKTSLVFGLRHEVGALNHVLTLLENHGINLLRIESRPHRSRHWEYLFFVDVEGHQESQQLTETLEAMQVHCTFIKVLGSYPRAQEQA